MKDKSIITLVVVILFFICITIIARAQTVVFSSWASAQVVHAVEVDKPVVKYDTTRIFTTQVPMIEILNTFTYKDFRIEIINNWRGCTLICISGSTRLILRPEDEYDILEKLIPLTR